MSPALAGRLFTTSAPWEALIYIHLWMGFPNSSVGKEFACDAGDPGSISGSGRSAGKGIGYPLQYSWASLVAQLVKNPPAMQDPWVGKVPGDGKGYPLQYSGLENSINCKVHRVTKSWTQLSNFHSTYGWAKEDVKQILFVFGHSMACKILVPQPGIEPVPSAVKSM